MPLEVGGSTKYGELLDVRREPKFFDPHRLHATFPWKGRRVIIAAYVIRNLEKLGTEQREQLEGLRFHLPVSGITADGVLLRPSRDLSSECGVTPEEFGSRTLSDPAPAPIAGIPATSASRRVQGSLRVEPPVHVSGSLRVERWRPSSPPFANRRLPVPRAGRGSSSSDITS